MYIPTLSAHPAPAMGERIPKLQSRPCRIFCVCKEDRFGWGRWPYAHVAGLREGRRAAGDLGSRGLTPLGSEPTLVLRGYDAVPARERFLPGGPARNPALTGSPLPRVA